MAEENGQPERLPDGRFACCAEKENLRRVTGESFARCKVCGRRHFTMDADAGRLGLTGSDI